MEWLDLFYATLVGAVLAWVLIRANPSVSKNWMIGLFAIKIIATFVQELLFTYYYSERSTADIYRFFDDGHFLFEAFWQHPNDILRIIFGWYGAEDGFKAAYFEQMNAWLKPFDTGYYNDNRFMIRCHASCAS